MYKNPNPIDLRVAFAIHFWRVFNRQSQHDLCQSLGVYRTQVSQWECSRKCPSTPTFIRIAEGLEVSPSPIVANVAFVVASFVMVHGVTFCATSAFS
jgi:transcriptional regulator with XRE-family HTH domain